MYPQESTGSSWWLNALLISIIATAIFVGGILYGQAHPNPGATDPGTKSQVTNAVVGQVATEPPNTPATQAVQDEMSLVYETEAPATMKHSVVNTDVAVTVGQNANVLDTGITIQVKKAKHWPGITALVTRFPEQDPGVEYQPLELIWTEDFPRDDKDPLWRIITKGREVLLHFDEVTPAYDYEGSHVPEQAHFTAIIIAPATQTLTHAE